MELISPAYKALLTEKHDNKPWGGAGSSWAPIVAPYLNILPMGASVLDFGCGRATFKPAILKLRPDLRVEEYDPGVRGKDVLPHERFDYVVCTDVMEHVEEQFVDNTLDILAFLCKLGIFFNIDCGLSRSLLPDGTNTHITVKPREWWMDKLREFFPDMVWTFPPDHKNRLVVAGRTTRAPEI